MKKISIKTQEELKVMAEGGKKLALIKHELMRAVKPDVSAMDIEELAQKLIKKAGGKPSFAMVPRYNWATCISINDSLVHGIPKKEMTFTDGDVVSIDVGIFYKGFHTDTSTSVLVGEDKKRARFLRVGREAFEKAVVKARAGNYVYDLSKAIQTHLEKNDLVPIRALVGHGIGRDLHEDPMIPCFVSGKREATPKIVKGMALAIEVMYTTGSPDVYIEDDGWTIRTKNGKISGLFEETVAITDSAAKVLTD